MERFTGAPYCSLRALRAHPVLSATLILVRGLGIGSNGALFAVPWKRRSTGCFYRFGCSLCGRHFSLFRWSAPANGTAGAGARRHNSGCRCSVLPATTYTRSA